MPTLPSEFLTVILPYASLFCKRVFVHVQLLVAGAILAPGKRTISSVLRIVGLHQEKAFHKYHGTAPFSGRITPAPRVVVKIYLPFPFPVDHVFGGISGKPLVGSRARTIQVIRALGV